MNFGNNCFNYIQEAFPQHQGVQQIFTNQAESTSFHGLAHTTGSGFMTQPRFWPEYHGYQPQKHSGLLGSATALPQFLPVPEIQVHHPVHLQGYHGGPSFQGRAVPFDHRLQGSMVFVDALGHQNGTSVASHPQLQAPLVTMDGTGLQYSASMAFTAPQMQAPVTYAVANGQQLVASGPFLTPQPQAPVMLIDGPALLHGAPVPVDSVGLQHGNAVALNSQVAPFVAVNTTHLQHVASMHRELSAPMQFACKPQLLTIEELAAGPSSANLARPAPVVKPPSQQCQQDPKAYSSNMPGPVSCNQRCGTTASSRSVATKTAVSDKPKKTWDEDLRAMLGCPVPSSTICSQDSLVAKKESKKRRAEGAKQKNKGPSTNIQAQNTALTKITKDQAPKKARTEIKKDQEAKTSPTKVGRANTVLPKESKEAGNKDKKRKHTPDTDEKNKRKEKRCKKATNPTEKTTKSISRDEDYKPDSDRKADGSKVAKAPVSKPKQEDVSQTSQSDGRASTSFGTKQLSNIPFTSCFKVPKKPNNNAPVCSSKQCKPTQLLYDERFIEACSPPVPQRRPRHHGQRHHAQRHQGHQQQSRSQPSRPQPSHPQQSCPQPSRPQQSRQQQSRQQQSGPPPSPEYKPRPKTYKSIDEIPHYYKNHSEGSVGRYGDGETIIYLKPEKGSKGLFPLPHVNLPPLPPGAPRRFHCREYSNTITAERRDQIEAMKRISKAKREEEANITGTGMNCNVLAERQHLPYVWPCEDNWWETGLGDVEKIKECKYGARDEHHHKPLDYSLAPVISDDPFTFGPEDLFYSTDD